MKILEGTSITLNTTESQKLLNDLMKILFGLGIFNCIILKNFGSDCNCKNSISQ